MLHLKQVVRYPVSFSTQLLDESCYNLANISQLRVPIVIVGEADGSVLS